MVIVSVAIAVGIIPIAAPTFWDAVPPCFGTIMHLGISVTAIVAVVLNVLFNEVRAGDRPGPWTEASRAPQPPGRGAQQH